MGLSEQEIRQLVLHKIKRSARLLVSEKNLVVDIVDLIEEKAKELIIKLTMPAEPIISKEVNFSYKIPRSWWQMLKEKHFSFLCRLFPVKYKFFFETKEVILFAGYPRLPIIKNDETTQTICYVAQVGARGNG